MNRNLKPGDLVAMMCWNGAGCPRDPLATIVKIGKEGHTAVVIHSSPVCAGRCEGIWLNNARLVQRAKKTK